MALPVDLRDHAARGGAWLRRQSPGRRHRAAHGPRDLQSDSSISISSAPSCCRSCCCFVSAGHFMFGYAKPVPVRFDRLRHPRRDMVWVALAGPGDEYSAWPSSRRCFCSALSRYLPSIFSRLAGGQSRELGGLQRDPRRVQHDPAAALGWRSGGGRIAAGRARHSARPERALRHAHPDHAVVPPAVDRRADRDVNLNLIGYIIERPVGWLLDAIIRITGVGQ